LFFLYWYCTVNIAHAWSLIEHVIRLEHPLQGKALESWAGHCTTRSVTWHGKDSIKSIYLKAEEIVTNKMYYKSFSPLLRALFCCLLWHVSQSRSLPFQFWSKLKQDFAGNFKWIASFGSGFCLFCFSLNLKQRHLVRSNAYTEQWPWWDAVETETTAQTKAEHSGAMMFRCFDVLHSFVACPGPIHRIMPGLICHLVAFIVQLSCLITVELYLKKLRCCLQPEKVVWYQKGTNCMFSF